MLWVNIKEKLKDKFDVSLLNSLNDEPEIRESAWSLNEQHLMI